MCVYININILTQRHYAIHYFSSYTTGTWLFSGDKKNFILLLGLLLTSALRVNRYIPTLLHMPQGV